MPGQCYGCGTEFGIFKKEHGCKNCGFAFCSKCLHDKTVPIPKRNNEKHRVCHKCFKILTGQITQQSASNQFDLPQAYIKRVAALNERSGQKDLNSAPSVSTQKSQKLPQHLRNLDKKDIDIARRLEQLKESRKPKENVTDDQLRARIADLKGEKPSSQSKPAYQAPDRRTQVEQIDDLLDEIADEVGIDNRAQAPDPVKDVESRLAHLRYGDAAESSNSKEGVSGSKFPSAGASAAYPHMKGNSESGEQANMDEMQRLMEQMAEESAIDARRAVDGMKQDKELMDRLIQLQQKKDSKSNDETEEHSTGTTMTVGGLNVDLKDDCHDDSSEDEETASRKLIQRYLDEAKIDEKVGASGGDITDKKKPTKPAKTEDDNCAGSDYDDSDELPFCCICNEDATIRCKDCSLDLYCKRCFRECHKDIDITDHVTMPYKVPKGYRH